MIVPHYVPGDWFAVVTDGSVVLLPPTTSGAVVEEMWESLRERSDLTAHLQVLTRERITELPPFALVSVAAGRVHVIVRGAVEVEVDGGRGHEVLTAPDVSTWSEAVVPDGRTVVVRAGGAPGRSADGVLPVLSGVVRAEQVQVTLREPDTSAPRGRRAQHEAAEPAWPVPAPAPTPAPTPAPAPGPPFPAEPAPVLTAASRRRRALTDTGIGEHGLAGAEPEPSTSPEPSTGAPPAAPPEPSPAPAQPSAPEPTQPADDHDGLTVLSSDVVALRRQLPEWAGDAVPGPLSVPAPESGPPCKIRLSSGLVVALNRPVLLGRAPQVSRVTNSELPRLVTVSSPNQDISRTHAEVRQEGEDVVVTDLRSTNGVLLLRQGSGPQRLHPGEPTVVEPGVVVDLGENVTFVVERGT